ncbi:hypothetical protein EYR36_010021 [Pleurotus pulmonarius]|nr:hypothetical protein EYR36_010021 [Pleurotus pulmonarius]KAF4593497.1 hypothetical protein EYR38_009212 [Pleurotus pulmonarius]
MAELPPEIHVAIIETLNVDIEDDRKTLLNLLVVSRYWNSLALPKLYRDVSIDLLRRRSNPHNVDKLKCLLRGAAPNPGWQFTTSMVLKAQDDFLNQHCEDTVIGLMQGLIPYLVNVRRLGLWLKVPPVDAQILLSLPPRAPLTHLTLKNCSLRAEDIVQLLSARPTLRWLVLYSSGRDGPSRDILLPAGALPCLRYLAMSTVEVIAFDGPLPSLVCLELRSPSSTYMPPDRIYRALSCFTSIVACSLVNFPSLNISEVLPRLPNLKYLRLQIFLDPTFDYSILSATKLTYLLSFARHGVAQMIGPKVFEFVESMVVVDVNMPGSTLARMYHGEIHHPEYRRAGDWNAWWEEAERVVGFVNQLSTARSAGHLG